jgi:glycosyltransferase involved in cell wall biosynthesis
MPTSVPPIFSVIIPSRDRPQFVGQAIASVLAQNLRALEVIVVNDGAQPITQPADNRAHILDNQMRGLNAARNLAVQHARGRFIAFLDDDDVWTDKDFLFRAANTLMTKGGFYFADGEMRFADGRSKLFSKDADVSSLALDNTILISALCYETKLHKALGLFDESIPYYADWDWYLRVARAGHHFYHDRTAVVDIRVHAQNMSGQDNSAARRADLNALCKKHNLGEISLKNHIDFV